MKKILIFSTAYFPLVGGAEVAVNEITNRINNCHWDLITIRINNRLPRKERIGNVNVYRVGIGLSIFDKFLLPFFGFFKALNLNKKNNYDIAWSIMASQASIGASFFKIFKPKIKLLLTLQEGDKEEHLKRYVFGNNLLYKIFIQPWHLLVFKKADYATAISNDLKQRALLNGIKCEVKIIPNGVDIAHFSQEYNFEELDKLKRRLDKGANNKFLITTSRLVKKNALDDVIKSLQYLAENIKFLILGDGPDRNKLEKLAEKLKVKNRVKFLGLIDHKIMPKYLKISDIFIRPSLSEGLGNSFLEAMAAEIPVIATQEGGITDFLFDSEKNPDKKTTGWAVSKKNPKEIAEIVKKILNNPEQTKKVVANAKKMVFEKYNWDIIAKAMQEYF